MREYYHPNEQEIIKTLIALFENRKGNDWKIGVPTASGLLKKFLNSKGVHVSIEVNDLIFIYETGEEGNKLYHRNNRLMIDFFALLSSLKDDKLIHTIEMDGELSTNEIESMKGIGNIQICDDKIITKYPNQKPFDMPGLMKDCVIDFGLRSANTMKKTMPIDYLKEEFGINIYTTIFPTESLIDLAHNKFESIEKRRFDIDIKESKKQTKWSRWAFIIATITLIVTFSLCDYDKTILKFVIDSIVGLFKSVL